MLTTRVHLGPKVSGTLGPWAGWLIYQSLSLLIFKMSTGEG